MSEWLATPCVFRDGHIEVHPIELDASIWLLGTFDDDDLLIESNPPTLPRITEHVFHRVRLAYRPGFIGPWEQDCFYEADTHAEACDRATIRLRDRGVTR